MTNKTPSEQADEIVEMFRDCIDEYPVRCSLYCNGGDIERKPASISLAILHVTGIIEVLWNIDNVIGKDSISILPQINHYQQILTILKEKL